MKSANVRGTYLCPLRLSAYSKEHKEESQAESQLFHTRCTRDQITFSENSTKLTRTFYNTIHCEIKLGEVVKVFEKPSCVLMKTNSSWIGEDMGKCRLDQIPMNRALPVDVLLNCSVYPEDLCKQSKTSLNKLKSECTRYAE